jgi:hypothetical protein
VHQLPVRACGSHIDDAAVGNIKATIAGIEVQAPSPPFPIV